jgi:hypothetical protein
VATSSGSYWHSTKNIVGTSLAVVGPALALAGVLAPPVGLVLAPVLYAVGALAAPGRKKPELASGVDAHDVEQSLAELKRRVHGRVPVDIEQRVRSIASTITDILPRADALGAGSDGRYVLAKTATDYLPSAVQAYLDLPRAYADSKVVTNGKTPRALLCDQLDVLTEQMDEVSDAVNRADIDKLVANGRFLEEKFGHGPLDLSHPQESASPPEPEPPPPPPASPPPPES